MSYFECNAYGAKDASVSSVVEKLTIKRRTPGPNDVHIRVEAATICHTDIHMLRGELMPVEYPKNTVVGHEGIGVIVAVGENVSKEKIGKWVGIGCMVGTECTNEQGQRTCKSCTVKKDERTCPGRILTYGTPEIVDDEQTATKGCYSTDIVINEHFAIPLPDYYTLPENRNFAPAIMCAGVTVYTALRKGKCGPGMKVGIVGCGGLGVYALLLAKAMGADEVYGITRSESKRSELMELGCCNGVIVSSEEEQMKAHNFSFDLIIDTISASHDMYPILTLAAPDASIGLIGVPLSVSITPMLMVANQLNIYGSMIGTLQHHKEVLEMCAENQIKVPVELIHPRDIETSYTRVINSDVKFRFAVDIDAIRRGE